MTEPTAWGDESIRMSLSPPSYLLAASWPEPGYELDLAEFERIKPKGASKLHWMDMDARLKRQSIQALSRLPMLHTLIVANDLPGKKQERGRRKCLEVLLPALETKGISLLILESRGRLNDSRDIELLLSLRRSGAVSEIEIDHRRGSDDETLWVPDQILGAFAEIELEGKTGLICAENNWAKISEKLAILQARL